MCEKLPIFDGCWKNEDKTANGKIGAQGMIHSKQYKMRSCECVRAAKMFRHCEWLMWIVSVKHTEPSFSVCSS